MYKTLLTLFTLSLAGALYSPGAVEASENRLALLVANQNGWKGDPKLDFALKGDLYPLAQELKKIGFKVITLANANAAKVREVLTTLKTKSQNQKATTTFLFYYSGHAGKKYLHLGPKGPNPLGYKEFSELFTKIQFTRRIAIFDSCYSGELVRQFGDLHRYKKLVKEGKHKGFRGVRSVNLKKFLVPNQGKEEGIRVISSSLALSWELKRYNSSVFTHHLLQGLKGKADFNRDGKISIDELFDFASQKVKRDTGQKPQQLLLLKRSSPYALAPAYRSRLWIGPKVKGNLEVSVGNFLWTKEKKDTSSLRLSVVHGKGSVFLRSGKRCYRQSLLIPKGSEVKLSSRWHQINCKRLAMRSKGQPLLVLPAQSYVEPPITTSRHIGIHVGYTNSGIQELHASQLRLGVDLRWNFLGFGFHYTTGQPDQKSFGMNKVFFRSLLGWPIRVNNSFEIFAGLYTDVGLAFLNRQGELRGPAFAFGAGSLVDMLFWFTPRFGLRVGAELGVDYVPVGWLNGLSLAWQLQTALTYRF